jgi:hypothetical protein
MTVHRFVGALRFAVMTVRPLAMAVYLAMGCVPLAWSYVLRPEILFGDVRIYFRATDAWLRGANPWLTDNAGDLFAAPPPALLLNVPLIPLGEHWAVVIWMVASAVAAVFIQRRLNVPVWFLLFYPLVEGFFGGSPDLVLAALALAGGGALAGLVKPYSVPAMLSDGRYIAVGLAAVLVLATLPLLPWGEFLASGSTIAATSLAQSHPNSALGIPVLMVVTALALVSLGPRLAFALAVPALFGQQPHYAVFSLLAISRSTIATLGAGWPTQGAAAVGVIVYAVIERAKIRRRANDSVRVTPQ